MGLDNVSRQHETNSGQCQRNRDACTASETVFNLTILVFYMHYNPVFGRGGMVRKAIFVI